MRCLIRRITRKSKSGVGHTVDEVEADALTIGRATDQHVFLSDIHVALRHAVIRPVSDGRFAVQARTPSGVRINRRTVQTGILKVGDVLSIGEFTLRLVRPPREYDLGLEVEQVTRAGGGQPGVGATSLRATGLGKRSWAWLLFLLIGGFGLAVPLAQIHRSEPPQIHMDDFAPDPDAGMPWRLAGGDHLWDSGAMSRAHRFFGRECRACHREPFQRVTNEACLVCHADEAHHTAAVELLQSSGLRERRCAGCHREHEGTEGLIATDSQLCTACHARPDRTMAGSRVHPVVGFGGGAHPEFRVRVVASAADGGFDWRRMRLQPGLAEDNGLVFPHDVHLDPGGIDGPDGSRVLECGSCHRPERGGHVMQPVRFEDDCQSCHRLDFEPNEPARTLPHGDPATVMTALVDYYARVALAGGYRDPDGGAPAVVRRQRPADAELDREQRRAALAWADAKAAEVAAEVIEYRTCNTCHAVERGGAGAGWQVEPVALTQAWFAEARFSHEPHAAMSCSGCHAAAQSGHSADVLVPGIETCRQCHGDPESSARIASRCIDCHGFHIDERLTMGRADAAPE